MEAFKHIVLELLLIVSGVLVFRSLWYLMDIIPIFNQVYVHVILLVMGIIFSIYAVNKLTHAD
ncbi:hypothetical protein HYX11_05490 [Candidatus Woesearchaeota archaeon]|nr:hypothetical protein [Candidatus Woesearchaeota archaeon]